MIQVRRKLHSWVTVTLLSAVACTGQLDDPGAEPLEPGSMPGPKPGGPKPPGTGGSGGSTGGTVTPGACSIAPPPLMRRLSHVEWAASVRDLFPTTYGVKGKAVLSSQELPAHWTKLPEDAQANGFFNRASNLNPTPTLIAQYADATAAVAKEVMANPSDFLPCSEPTAACGEKFIDAFAVRAYRRPLTAEERTRLLTFWNARLKDAGGFEGAVRLTLEYVLQAPQFLYRAEQGEGGGKPTQHEVASRLSYLLWSSLPDAELLSAAQRGLLKTPQQLEAQAARMMKDPRFAFMAQQFHAQWLYFDKVFQEETRDKTLYPSVPQGLRERFRKEAELFVGHVMSEGGGGFKGLLTSPVSFADDVLASFYKSSTPAGAWGKVDLNPQQRSGFLTRGLFNWSWAHSQTSSPPLRGVFVIRRMLCASLPAPPDEANTTPPTPTKAGTTRELFTRNSSPSECTGCHRLIDPIGFGFEHYDAIGAHRSMENGKPIDASGSINLGTDVDGPFNGAIELSQKLASSATVEACMLGHWFEYSLGRARSDGESCAVDGLRGALRSRDGDLRGPLMWIVTNPGFTSLAR